MEKPTRLEWLLKSVRVAANELEEAAEGAAERNHDDLLESVIDALEKIDEELWELVDVVEGQS